MKFKNGFLTLIALTFVALPTNADDVINNITNMARNALPIYNKLESCSPINSDYFQIYGFENNKCHFKYVYYDCYAPIEITRKVAQNSRKGALDIINNGNFSTSANTPESKYNEAFFNNKAYCSTNH